MENQPSHDELRRTRSEQLRTEIARRGLPRAYINRLVSELDDHLLDLLEERNSPMGAARKLQPQSEQDAQQRLGEPTQLAIFAADQYHSRTFWGRHPLVTFLFAPVPLLTAMVAAYLAAVWAATFCVGMVGDLFPSLVVAAEDHLYLQAIVLTLFQWGLIVLPPLAAALLLCRVYQRNALHVRWPLVGCLILAIAPALLTLTFQLATGPNEHERGLVMAGFFAAASPTWFFLTFLPRFALAFGIGCLVVKRAQQQLEIET